VTASNAELQRLDAPLKSLGPYRLERLLGRGGMAEVYLALKYGASGFERRVALKTLRPEHQGDHVLERLLIEEAKVGARFHHRNLVQVHDLGVDQGRYYVCMDLVDGADLRSLTRPERLPPALALHVAEEVAFALEYVHELKDDAGRALGLVHRDVSPGNILLSRMGEVRLADFGIAKATLLADITWGRFRKGKVAYMSPEQLDGGSLTPQSDQFALGVTLAEMISGRRPFDGPSPLDTMERIRRAENPDLAGVPRRVRQVLARCLKRQPSARWKSPAELRQALRRLRRHRDIGAPAELAAWVSGRVRAWGL
jgi:serine/threonine-protein kinase